MVEANITWVTDQVATGGDFSFNPNKAQRQFEELLGMDIDLVIDCRIEASDEEVWRDTPVTYLHLPVDDNYGERLPRHHFDAAVEAAMPVLEGGGKVFVHCHMGINRGPSTAYALLLETGVPATRAFDLIRKMRPAAAVYYAEDALRAHLTRRGLKKGTKKYEERIRTFLHHHRKVFTRVEWNSVQHIIRTNHQQDHKDLMGV